VGTARAAEPRSHAVPRAFANPTCNDFLDFVAHPDGKAQIALLRANAMARHTVTLELNDRWVKMVRSPVYFVATALMGVSVSFAPLFLYWSAQGKFFPGFEWIIVPVCFAVIYCVPGFFFVFGQAAAESLRQQPTQGETGR
jgi:hypothetical protein